MVTTKPTTVEDVERLPNDDHRSALIRGVLYRMSPVLPRHARVASRADRVVGSFVEEHGLGEVYVELGFVLARDPDVLLAPDVSFVRADRLPDEEGSFPDLAPDLAIEVGSPGDTRPEVEEKVREYLAGGVLLVWVFDPVRRTVRVRGADGTDRVLTEDGELDGGDVLPGFRVRVSTLFERPPRR